jgi:NAD+ synthase
MRDYREEFEKRVDFIKGVLKNSGAAGIVYGNSGGKDSALVGILCKAACPNTVGIIMPCASKRNFGEDRDDGIAVAEQFDIETRTIDLTSVREAELEALKGITDANPSAVTNIAPRLRMITLYAVAASENMLVAGTGNRSEYYMGYFTKWGDGACDLNPIRDLTATEVFEFLRYLDAPAHIIEKAPSAGLFEGQTDEAEMGVTYKAIDDYLLYGIVSEKDAAVIDRYHSRSEHKRTGTAVYQG